MKNIIALKQQIFILGTVIFLFLSLSVQAAHPGHQLTVENIFGSDRYQDKTLGSIQWIPGENSFSWLDSKDSHAKIIRYDMNTNSRSILLSDKDTDVLLEERTDKRFTIPAYRWSPDGQSILISSQYNLYLYHIKTGKNEFLSRDFEEERDPRFAPDGKKLAYIKKDNLCVYDLETKTETGLTEHGSDTRLIGRFDWVYEEEFSIRTGFSWSPDSRHIAFFELEQSIVPEYPILDFIPVHNPVHMMRYPKAGDPNASIRIGIVPSDSGRVMWASLDKETDYYIPRIKWLPDSRRLAVQRLNRDQNRLDLFIVDIETGQTRKVLTEKDPDGWVDYNTEWIFLKDGKHMIWKSERSGWNHLYKINLETGSAYPLTAGSWDVVSLNAVDETTGAVYFTGTAQSSIERHLYQTDITGSSPGKLTCEPGTHVIQFSPDSKYYLDEYSSIDTPPRTSLHDQNGLLIDIIETGHIEAFDDMVLPSASFFELETTDHLKLNAKLIKPADFDSTKQYPLLIYTYGAPGSQSVRNIWHSAFDLWHFMLARMGYLIAVVDNRGTDMKGNTFKNLVYKNISLGLKDQIDAARYLGQKPYIDNSRIGIWGWSAGGYMTCLAMTKGADVFKAGIAVAPLTDPLNYDTIWIERYMDQPSDNKQGYHESNPVNFVHQYKGGLLIIHGTSDDNVHPANTMQMVYTLQNAGKLFQMMLYPRKLHSIRGQKTRIHLFNTMTDYILKNL